MRSGLTDEHRRILRAADERRLRTNKHGRYVIDGDVRPVRQVREQLQRWGLLDWRWDEARPRPALAPEITEQGRRVLAGEGNGDA